MFGKHIATYLFVSIECVCGYMIRIETLNKSQLYIHVCRWTKSNVSLPVGWAGFRWQCDRIIITLLRYADNGTTITKLFLYTLHCIKICNIIDLPSGYWHQIPTTLQGTPGAVYSQIAVYGDISIIYIFYTI